MGGPSAATRDEVMKPLSSFPRAASRHASQFALPLRPYNPRKLALAPGTRLGPYEITAQIGVGGMGEVYRATDTKLKREVAVKVLPAALASDPERLARFQREAEVLASLNHPNIAAIHGLEESEGTKALVMELVEGPTLADRIAQGAIPVDEALPIAKQIAEALEAAHEQGIIHRDLKPANIKVRADGTVKVLDFGLAKALEPTGAMSPEMSQAPTITTPAMTLAGMILGTAAYMSPEQARGKPVDKRADIWAFGCVLFEMITGTRAFPGEDITDTLAAVVKLEPNWDAVGAEVPSRVRQTLHVCLQKNPHQRGGDIAAIRLALEGAFEIGATVDAASVTSPSPRWWSRPRWVATGVTLGLLAGLGSGWVVWVAGRADTEAPVRRFPLTLPTSVVLPSGGGTRVGLSPDGQTVAYIGVEGGVARLYQWRLDQLGATVIPGTEGAARPFFSQDSRSVAFQVDRSLMRVGLAGGLPTRIADLGAAPRGGSWGPDDTIVVGRREQGLARVSATGGEMASLTTPDDGRQHWYPQILPGGRAVLFSDSAPFPNGGDVMVLDLDSGESRTVVAGGVAGHYTPSGHLVFLRGGDLWAVAFDLATLTVRGQPALVEQGIRVETGAAVQFGVAEDGSLAYLPSRAVRVEAHSSGWIATGAKSRWRLTRRITASSRCRRMGRG